jgi:hypothetical protein
MVIHGYSWLFMVILYLFYLILRIFVRLMIFSPNLVLTSTGVGFGGSAAETVGLQIGSSQACST